jgi:predicted RecB family nuclease
MKSKPKSTILSKSKLMDGLQCEKKLWLLKNKPDLEAEVSAATQMQFDEGNEVGVLAQEHFGKGVVVDCDYWDYDQAVKLTSAFIKAGETTIFEASFKFDSFFSRADIFNFNVKKKAWDIIEVKKSTSVKDYHLLDSAIQTWIIIKSGFKVNSVSLMHINNQCESPNLQDLFTLEDITNDVMELIPTVENKARSLLQTVTKKTEPKIKIGPHCDDPFECNFKDHCWMSVPERSVFDAPGIKTLKKWDLYNSGITQITDLNPDDFKEKTKRAIEVTKKNKLWVDKAAIKSELKNWTWPLYFFDFETIAPAIPRYQNTKPYQQIPFQFSCHVWHDKTNTKITSKQSDFKNTLDHFEYLHTEATDPRPFIISAMLKGLGTTGSIVAYNKSFEVGVIKKLAEYDKKNSSKLLKLIDRFVDPLPIFQNHTYHPDYLGSFSIKAVAPALLGSALSYDDLIIGNGQDAQVYANILLSGFADDDVSNANDKLITKDQMIESLLTYCQQDTLAMVELVKWLISKSE